jgi:anti-sigma factor RsiW
MPDEPKTPAEILDEELVAYLDGELDEGPARKLEARLAAEEPVRQRLKQLAQSWDLLDQLPRTNVDDKFARTTVQTVTLAIAQQVQDDESTEPARRRWRWITSAALVIGCGVAGFLLIGGIYGQPNERLLRDLPVIENVELYRQAGDLDFLHKLQDEGLFVEEPSDGS